MTNGQHQHCLPDARRKEITTKPTDVRIPAEAERDQIAHLLSTSLNFPRERVLARAPKLPLQDFRCAYEDDRIVASAAEFHFLQWFGGRSMAMSAPGRRGTARPARCR